MRLCVLTTEFCGLGQSIASALQTSAAVVKTTRFPHGEVSVAVPHVRDANVFVVHSTSPPVNDPVGEVSLAITAWQYQQPATPTSPTHTELHHSTDANVTNKYDAFRGETSLNNNACSRGSFDMPCVLDVVTGVRPVPRAQNSDGVGIIAPGNAEDSSSQIVR